MELQELSSNQATWIHTKDQNWLIQWDAIQRNHKEGMFTQTSSWLSSYRAYGFDFELLIKVDSRSQIEAGMACLLIKAGPFIIYSCPWGPFSLRNEFIPECLEKFDQRAKEIGAMVSQLNPAWRADKDLLIQYLENGGYQKGTFLKKVFVPTDFNMITLPSHEEKDWERILLKSFSENAKRNIKTALKQEVILKKVQSLEELEEAYGCFQANADREGYAIRSWEDIRDSLWDGVKNENSLVLFAQFQGQTVGAIWCAHGGNMLSYIMGGVDRTEKDLKLGHLLQWSAISEAVRRNYTRYNISVGGSEGVVRFKSSFYPTQISSTGPYFKVLRKAHYLGFKAVFPFLEKNKKLASRILKLIK